MQQHLVHSPPVIISLLAQLIQARIVRHEVSYLRFMLLQFLIGGLLESTLHVFQVKLVLLLQLLGC
jgi:hypothetical protein